MDRGLFIAAHTASALMDKQALIANNLANVSTPGFKKQYQLQSTYVADAASKLSTRGYAVVNTPGVDLKPGALMTTGNPMHIAMEKNQFLSIQTPEGVAYTKRGDLQINGLGILVLSSGEQVLSVDGQPIEVPAGFGVKLGVDGVVSATDPANPLNVVVLGNLGIFDHSNAGVSQRADGFLGLTEPVVAVAPKITVGALESSNVSAAQMMTEMIETARQYDLGTKLMGTFEQLERRGSELLALYR